jgi:hypothetical protein
MKTAHASLHSKSVVTFALIITTASLLAVSFSRVGRAGSASQLITTASALSDSTKDLTTERARAAYGQIEMSFEASSGLNGKATNFRARGAGYTLSLKPTQAVFLLDAVGKSDRNKTRQMAGGEMALAVDDARTAHKVVAAKPVMLRMSLLGANNRAAAAAADELAGKVNYFIGNDPAKWRTNVPTFARVSYREVYPGIDLIYYGNQRQLEYDFRVAPGIDPSIVSMKFEGTDKLAVDDSGDLSLTLRDKVIKQPKPFVYQEVAGERRRVDAGYVVDKRGQVGFTLGAYDNTLPLVIDPTLVYSTYLGGSGGEQGMEIAVDSAGNAYVSGFTNSTNFPTANAVQAANGGFQDAFVSKINAAGTALVYSTYLGGNGNEQSRGVAADSAGNAYVVGQTNSTNFPTANAFDATLGSNGEDVFVTKLNAAGSALVYSTYLGGSDSAEFGEDIAVDSAGNAYVTGSTFSNDYPTVNPIQATFGGFTDAFVTKINAAGSALVYSTYLGGSESEIGEGINVDSAGNVYVTGDTKSTNFPTANAVQATNGGDQDAFVTKINAAGSAFIYSTYLGGSAQDDGEAIAPDSSGNTYLTGNTFSTNFPTANAIQPVHGGGVIQDAFVTKINAAGSALVYSTYLGGTGGEIGFGIAVDSAGNAYVAGGTGSLTSFPTANALQCGGGGQDAFVTKINAAGNAFVYSTYLGGSANENARGVALDSAGNAYVAGFTRSTDFPTRNPIQSNFGGDTIFGDAFVLKLSDATSGPASPIQFTQSNFPVTEDVAVVTLNLSRTGDTSGAVTVDYATADGTASERSDYTTALGTLRFAAGEITKSITILVNEDSKVEGPETFTVTLSNPTGGATLSCVNATATISITDDASEPTTNVIDDSTIFVGTHYHDFLNRQADASGQTFWVNQIEGCALADATCREAKRINVSTAFFLSIEFQQTGYRIIRIYKASFLDTVARPRGLPRYREFLRDTQEVQRGVVIGTPGADTQLATNVLEFARRWVVSSEFVAQFPLTMTADQYVDQLFLRAEVTPTAAERSAAIGAFSSGGTEGRAQALLSVTDSGSVFNKQYNPGFVLMQYIGYLRRNPNDAPEPGLNYAGFDFWLTKMNQFTLPGEDARNEQVAHSRVQRAEMVKAFILSSEYRGRFAP